MSFNLTKYIFMVTTLQCTTLFRYASCNYYISVDMTSTHVMQLPYHPVQIHIM